ncbi:MAG: SRPBCC family protein [Vulcanimicrobiaceae bacterium]
MSDLRGTVQIDASAARVWEVLLDVERWPEWTPTMLEVRRLDAGPLAVGSSVLIRQPRLRPAEWTVAELDHAERSFTWTTRSFGVLVTSRHRVDERASGSTVTLSIGLSGPLSPVVRAVTRSMMKSHLLTEASGLKARSESVLVG